MTTANVIVGTEPQVALQKGSTGLLPCDVKEAVEYVQWIKGPVPFNNQPIITYYPHIDGSKKVGSGYTQGLYDITVNFSLIITKVEIDNEDTYFCTAHVIATKELSSNTTDVNVFGKYTL